MSSNPRLSADDLTFSLFHVKHFPPKNFFAGKITEITLKIPKTSLRPAGRYVVAGWWMRNNYTK
jgi:hypothetical protein